jgi:hypothetical protein
MNEYIIKICSYEYNAKQVVLLMGGRELHVLPIKNKELGLQNDNLLFLILYVQMKTW